MASAPNRVNPVTLDYLGYGAHRDDYTLMDHLDRRAVVRAVGEVVAKDHPPMVLGLHGDWGSGKTSTLRAIRFHLTNDNPLSESVNGLVGGVHSGHVVTVWFEAWRYQNEAAPVVALIQEMRRQLSLWQKANREIAKLTAVAAQSLLDSLDKAAKLIGIESLPFSAATIQTTGERYERDRLDQALPTDSIQEFLRQAIEGLLPPERKGFPKPRIVVFIDDLDRCSAELAYRLLEGLKIYLNLTNCVFILGMNQQVVIEAIAERLKKDDADKTVLLRAEAYLEKLCGNIWRLPLPADPVGYFADLVDDPQARAAIQTARIGIPAQMIVACPSFLPPNPRRLRALANVFNRLRKAADVLNDTFATDLNLRLLLVAYVYQFHAELFQRWHYDANFISRICGWLATATADEKSEPHFARLALPTQMSINASTPTPTGGTLESRFPDPSAPGIFWIAPLVQVRFAIAAPDEFAALLRLPV